MTQNVTVRRCKDTQKFGKSSERGEDLTKINIRPNYEIDRREGRPNYERDRREAGDSYERDSREEGRPGGGPRGHSAAIASGATPARVPV